MKLFELFLATGFIYQLCQSQCVFQDSGSSGQQLDLRALAHTSMEGTDGDYDYKYAPCQNAEKCSSDGTSYTAMATQSKTDECYVLANWDHGATTPSYDATDDTWKFEYMNGNDCAGSPRHFYAYFNCDPNAGDYSVESAGEITGCVYEMYVNSQWACPGEVWPGEDSSDISPGTIFVIIFGGALFLYFIVGWIICAFLNKKDRGFSDVVGNIPHSTFWSKLPSLVFAGCCYTKDTFVGLVSGNKGDKASESTGGDSAEYNTIDQN